jgi:hypothetical protein
MIRSSNLSNELFFCRFLRVVFGARKCAEEQVPAGENQLLLLFA